ncbi:hypothetical protein, partial [Leucobacter sp. M11]|uniref:hypothetical protein n=1 Tax=Leucobacter sp. M11 TaxID=2993565 RepID=UPI002D7F36E6
MLSVQTQSVLVLVVVLGLGAPLMAIIVSILEQLAPRLPIPAGVGAHTRQPDRGERAALLRRARAELGSFRVWGVFWFASVATLAATALVTTQSGTAAALLPGAALFLLGLWLLWAEHRLVRQRALMLARRSGPRSARAAQRLAARALGLAASPAVPIRLSRIPRGPSAVPAAPGTL